MWAAMMMGVVAAAVAAAAVTVCEATEIKYDRFHCMQYEESTGNFLFRSNMPVLNDEETGNPYFAYDTVLDYMAQRAPEECGQELPEDVYMIDISLCDVFDGLDWQSEKLFWGTPDNFEKGRMLEWPIGLAGVFPPYIFPDPVAAKYSEENIWRIDRIPDRVQQIKQMLETDYGKPTAIMFHCAAGCDRTGELGAAVYMTLQGMDPPTAYARDTAECGRSPNYFSTNAIMWYCDYLQVAQKGQYVGNMDPDCYDFAVCDPFGDCVPANTSSSSTPLRDMTHAQLLQAHPEQQPLSDAFMHMVNEPAPLARPEQAMSPIYEGEQ